ncbi:MAG: HEAT repeat domain-containing protein [Planctomycetes bacterium]|nr:HEAT repeat domain-containing protein [Planctomycetota bacterium]
MSEEISVRFSGSDEELDRLFAGAARAFGGRLLKDRRTGELRLVFGHFLSLNPNTVRWWTRVRREGGELRLRARTLVWPWTRAKHARIAAFRLAQIADYIEVRLRGGAAEKFEAPSSRLPFLGGGTGVAELTMAWSWFIVSCVSCGLMAWFATTLAGLFVVDPLFESLAERSVQVTALGGIALPSPAELAGAGFLFRLACSALLAFPVAFFVGSTYGLLQVAGEFWTPVSRAVWLAPVFHLVLLLFAFVPLMSAPTAIAMSILVPIAAHAGYTFVWGRKGEKRRPLGKDARRPLAAVASLALAAVVLGMMLPLPRRGREVTHGLVLFRDRHLLTNPVGRGLSLLYYRYTLYAAEPLKDFYDPSPDGYDRQVRTAHVIGDDPGIETRLRRIGFVVDPDPARGRRLCDLIVVVGNAVPPDLDSRAVAVAPGSDEGKLREAAAKASRAAFRGGGLRELAQLGWWSVFYLGPLVLFGLPAALLLPAISLLFRKLPRKAALAALGLLGALSAGAIVLAVSRSAGTLDAARGAREARTPAEALPRLAHAEGGVRFEAAHRLWALLEEPAHRSPSLRGPLVAALGDPDVRVRIWACGALGRLGDAEAVPALLRAIEDPEIFVRYRAAEALGRLRAEAAIEPLKKRAREDAWYCGMYALDALRRIRPGAH